MKQEYITLKMASKILGVTTTTLRTWNNNGKLKVIRTVGGHRRISTDEIERLLGVVGKGEDGKKGK